MEEVDEPSSMIVSRPAAGPQMPNGYTPSQTGALRPYSSRPYPTIELVLRILTFLKHDGDTQLRRELRDAQSQRRSSCPWPPHSFFVLRRVSLAVKDEVEKLYAQFYQAFCSLYGQHRLTYIRLWAERALKRPLPQHERLQELRRLCENRAITRMQDAPKFLLRQEGHTEIVSAVLAARGQRPADTITVYVCDGDALVSLRRLLPELALVGGVSLRVPLRLCWEDIVDLAEGLLKLKTRELDIEVGLIGSDPDPVAPASAALGGLLPCCERLRLCRVKIGPLATFHLQPSTMPALTSFELISNNLSSTVALGRLGLSRCRGLFSLRISRNDLTTSEVQAIGLAHLVQLKRLSLSENRIDDMRCIPTSTMPRLQSLELYGNPIRHFHLGSHSLVHLDLAGTFDYEANHAFDEFAHWFNEVQSLVHLHLEDCAIDNARLRRLALGRHPSLVWLSLSRNDFDDSGLRASGIMDSKTLKDVLVEGTFGLSDAFVSQLNERFDGARSLNGVLFLDWARDPDDSLCSTLFCNP